MRSRPAVLLANVAPQSLFIDDYLMNIKHAGVLQLCLAEINNMGIAIEPQFVIPKNEHVLDCCKKVCANLHTRVT